MSYRIEVDWFVCPLSDSAVPPLDTEYGSHDEAIRRGLYKACKRNLKEPNSDPWIVAAACGVVMAAANGCDFISYRALDDWLRILGVKIVEVTG